MSIVNNDAPDSDSDNEFNESEQRNDRMKERYGIGMDHLMKETKIYKYQKYVWIIGLSVVIILLPLQIFLKSLLRKKEIPMVITAQETLMSNNAYLNW